MNEKPDTKVVSFRSAFTLIIVTAIITAALAEVIDIRSLKTMQVELQSDVDKVYEITKENRAVIDANTAFIAGAQKFSDCMKEICLKSKKELQK